MMLGVRIVPNPESSELISFSTPRGKMESYLTFLLALLIYLVLTSINNEITGS
jgi:hypothetical protein